MFADKIPLEPTWNVLAMLLYIWLSLGCLFLIFEIVRNFVIQIIVIVGITFGIRAGIDVLGLFGGSGPAAGTSGWLGRSVENQEQEKKIQAISKEILFPNRPIGFRSSYELYLTCQERENEIAKMLGKDPRILNETQQHYMITKTGDNTRVYNHYEVLWNHIRPQNSSDSDEGQTRSTNPVPLLNQVPSKEQIDLPPRNFSPIQTESEMLLQITASQLAPNRNDDIMSLFAPSSAPAPSPLLIASSSNPQQIDPSDYATLASENDQLNNEIKAQKVVIDWMKGREAEQLQMIRRQNAYIETLERGLIYGADTRIYPDLVTPSWREVPGRNESLPGAHMMDTHSQRNTVPFVLTHTGSAIYVNEVQRRTLDDYWDGTDSFTQDHTRPVLADDPEDKVPDHSGRMGKSYLMPKPTSFPTDSGPTGASNPIAFPTWSNVYNSSRSQTTTAALVPTSLNMSANESTTNSITTTTKETPATQQPSASASQKVESSTKPAPKTPPRQQSYSQVAARKPKASPAPPRATADRSRKGIHQDRFDPSSPLPVPNTKVGGNNDPVPPYPDERPKKKSPVKTAMDTLRRTAQNLGAFGNKQRSKKNNKSNKRRKASSSSNESSSSQTSSSANNKFGPLSDDHDESTSSRKDEDKSDFGNAGL